LSVGERSFEELFGSLEEKARRLEQGNLPLEESLKLYEEGAGLVDQLRTILGAAELQVKTLQGRLDEDQAELREVEAEYGFEDEDGAGAPLNELQ
jgi:exodeoxyribonuclease VII small subunit